MRNKSESLQLSLCFALISFFFLTCSKKEINPPVITSYFPATAGGGDTVVVYGRNLPVGIPNFGVSLNNKPMHTIQSGQDSIITIIPKMAGSGKITISASDTVYTGPLFTYHYVATVTTVAGSGKVGKADGKWPDASFNCPWGITTDSNGDIYVADCYNRLIRKISGSTGEVSSITIPTLIDGIGKFYSPYNITLDRTTHNLYVTDFNKHLLKINASGQMKLIYDDRMPTTGIALGPDGFLYMSNNTDGTVIKLDTSGTAVFHFASGLITPRTVIFDNMGNMYVAALNICKITPSGTITTFANDPEFKGWEITRDTLGNIYEASHFNNILRMIEASTGKCITIAGSGTAADIDGVGLDASFNGPQGLTIDDDGNLYMTTYNYDTEGGNKIRKIAVR